MRPVQSPRTDDSSIEAELASKAVAPRVSQADMEANIVHIEYATHVSKSGQMLRWAVITTRSGFAVTGAPSASVSPENDVASIGEKVALENARQALWPLMGYALKERLAQPAQAPQETTFLDRLRAEHSQLRERLTKLLDFTGGDKIDALPAEQATLLREQARHMHNYEATLRDRLELIADPSAMPYADRL